MRKITVVGFAGALVVILCVAAIAVRTGNVRGHSLRKTTGNTAINATRVSPDGRVLAVAYGSNVILVDLKTRKRTVVKSSSGSVNIHAMQWSPNSKALVLYASLVRRKQTVILLDARTMKTVTLDNSYLRCDASKRPGGHSKGNRFNATVAEWSPDSKKLVLGVIYEDGKPGLLLCDVNGGTFLILDRAYVRYCSWSTDGKYLAWVTDRRVWDTTNHVYQACGPNVLKICKIAGCPQSTRTIYRGRRDDSVGIFGWTPGENQLVATVHPNTVYLQTRTSKNYANYDIVWMKADGKITRRVDIVKGLSVRPLGRISTMKSSNNCKEVAFAYNQQLYACSRDIIPSVWRIPFSGMLLPELAWSPNDKMLLYVTGKNGVAPAGGPSIAIAPFCLKLIGANGKSGVSVLDGQPAIRDVQWYKGNEILYISGDTQVCSVKLKPSGALSSVSTVFDLSSMK